MQKTHSASMEMIGFLQNYAAKRAEKRGTPLTDATILQKKHPMTDSERLSYLEQRVKDLEAARKGRLQTLADMLAPHHYEITKIAA
ncbi:MAG: hypothetical protein AAF621_08220 [Pseudomonadota bacterium]